MESSFASLNLNVTLTSMVFPGTLTVISVLFTEAYGYRPVRISSGSLGAFSDGGAAAMKKKTKPMIAKRITHSKYFLTAGLKDCSPEQCKSEGNLSLLSFDLGQV